MQQEQIFDNLLADIEKNKKAKEEGKVTSVMFPFERLSTKFPGWERGHYYCITAATSVGKTKLTKFLAVISVYKFIKDPLTHIVRNSCDHGIETSEERKKSGKHPTGII